MTKILDAIALWYIGSLLQTGWLKMYFIFLESELKFVKSTLDYNKALLDEAEDDVDRLLAAEGIIQYKYSP